MIDTRRAHRRVALALLSLAAFAVTGCASSSSGGGSSSSAAPSSSTSGPATSASAAVSSTAAAAGGGDVKKACSDYVALKKINDEFDQIGDNLSAGKGLMGSLVGTAADFAEAAPSVVASAAKGYLGAVTTLKAYVAKATSIQQLRQESASDPVLKNALVTLGSSSKQIETWSKAVCA